MTYREKKFEEDLILYHILNINQCNVDVYEGNPLVNLLKIWRVTAIPATTGNVCNKVLAVKQLSPCFCGYNNLAYNNSALDYSYKFTSSLGKTITVDLLNSLHNYLYRDHTDYQRIRRNNLLHTIEKGCLYE